MANAVDYYDDDRGYGPAVANSPATVRAAFVQRTYGHLAGAILALVGIEAALLTSGVGKSLMEALFRSNGSLLVLMLLFIGGGMLAQYLAQTAKSMVVQYAALAGYVVLEALILLPILYIADVRFPGQFLAAKAGIVTLAVFGGLTVGVFVSGRDFSFLRPFLWAASFAALGVILASMIFPSSLSLGGVLFPALMVLLMAGYIVYDTSNVMHHYHPSQHVAASLALFASVATMFYYSLRLFMSSRD